MDDSNHQRYRKPFPVARACFWIGMALVFAGYALLMQPAEEVFAKALNRAFLGMGLVVVGAALWLGAIFFKR